MIDITALLEQSSEAYMNDEQLSFFSNQLHALRQQTQQSIDLAHESLHENTVNSDPLDSATMEEIREITLMRVARDTQLLHEIEEAFDRIHNLEYGFCLESGEPIGLPRLLANPTAKYSTIVLNQRELDSKINGTSG